MLQYEELKCPKCGKNMSHGFASKAISLSFVEPYKLTKVFFDLSCLDGVLFLSKDQPSLALSSTIKKELEVIS